MADTVLVVDDHPLTREALSALLAQHGFSVVGAAADGEEATGLARRLQPQLVLLDLSMPGLSGLDALPRLREAAPGCGTAAAAPACRTRSRVRSPRARSRCCCSSTTTSVPTRSRAGSSSLSTRCART